MLNILFAPPSVDVFAELMRIVDKKERFFLIVPRHYSHECERRICELLGDGAAKYAEVLSIDRLFSRVSTECGGAAETFLDDAGKLLVAYSAAQKVAGAMAVFGGELRKTEFLTEALRFIDELSACCVTPETIGRAAHELGGDLGARLHDLSLIAGSYYAELRLRSARRDRIEALVELLDTGWAEDKTFAFFGYTEFTEQELEIVRRLMHSRRLTVALGCDRTLINPALGEDDPLYIYARTCDRLMRLAEDEGVPRRIDRIAASDARPPELCFIESDFIADESARFDGSSTAVTLAQERSAWYECERAAAYILETVRREGWKFRDFAVALPDDDDYRGAIEAVFGSWGVPVFMDNTDRAIETPVLSALTAALDIICGGFAVEDVLRYLKSGLSPLAFETCCELENYAYVWQISGTRWLRDFTGHPRGLGNEETDRDREKLEWLNSKRKLLVEPFEHFRERIRPGSTYAVSDILRAFYDLITEMRLDTRIAATARMYGKAGELRAANQYSQLWGKVCDLIDECAELAGNEQMKFDEFAQLFELLLGGVQVGSIPPALDGVPVGDVGRLRHRRPKALLLLGARAGIFPPAPVSVGLLDDHDREELAALEIGLEPASRRLAWRGIDTACSALTLPSERLYVSWSPSSEGADPTPSPLIIRLEKALGIAVEPPSDSTRLLNAESPALELAMRAVSGAADGVAKAALEYFERSGDRAELIERASAAASGVRGPISREAAQQLYGEKTRLNASASDKFASCPFSHFIQHGLHAAPLKRAELDSFAGGTMIHAILENAVRRASEEGLLKENITQAEKDAAQRLAREELERYAAERFGSAADDPRTKRLVARIGQSLERVMSSIMDEFTLSSFRPQGFEVKFGLDGAPLDAVKIGENGELRGIIDRVDSWTNPEDGRTYFRVVDYKSGRKKFDYTDIFHGVSLQLPIYIHALREYAAEQGLVADEAAAFYSPAAEPYYSGTRGAEDDEVESELEKQERRSGVYLEDPFVVEALEHGGGSRFLPSAKNYKLSEARFRKLERHVQEKMLDVVTRISEGEIKAHPSTKSDRSACDYCDFAAICRFDPSNDTDVENVLFTVSAENFWKRIDPDGVDDDANGGDADA